MQTLATRDAPLQSAAAREGDGPTEEVDDSVGVVCSTAHGLGGVRLARFLGLSVSGCDRAERRVTAVDPDRPDALTMWTRTFGRRSWTTAVTLTSGGDLVERAGPFAARFEVRVTGETLELRSKAIGLGSIGEMHRLPLTVSMTVTPAGDATMTTVEVDLGCLGQLRYVTTMRAVKDVRSGIVR